MCSCSLVPSGFNFTNSHVGRKMAVNSLLLCKTSVFSNQRRMLRGSEVAIYLFKFSGVAVEVEQTF